MATNLNVDVNKCAEKLKERFPQFQEYQLDAELPVSKGQYIAMKIQNENPVSFSIYIIISHNDGIMLRFGDLMLYVRHPEADDEMLNKIELILSDKLIAFVNYQNSIERKRGTPNFGTYFVMSESGEFDEDRRRLRDTLMDLKRNVTGLTRLFDKYRGINVITNWSGSMFETFDR